MLGRGPALCLLGICGSVVLVSGQSCAGYFHFNSFNTPAGLCLLGIEGSCGQHKKSAAIVIPQHAGIGIGFNADAVGDAASLDNPYATVVLQETEALPREWLV